MKTRSGVEYNEEKYSQVRYNGDTSEQWEEFRASLRNDRHYKALKEFAENVSHSVNNNSIVQEARAFRVVKYAELIKQFCENDRCMKSFGLPKMPLLLACVIHSLLDEAMLTTNQQIWDALLALCFVLRSDAGFPLEHLCLLKVSTTTDLYGVVLSSVTLAFTELHPSLAGFIAFLLK